MSGAPAFRPAWLAKLSHDLRNQLSPMRTATQLMQSGRLDGERQAEMLQLMERQILRMVRMLDDVSEYGHLAEAPLKRERLHLDYVIDSALGECGRKVAAAGQTIEVELPDERIAIEGDRARLMMMMLRLLDNAVRFNRAGGVVRVSARARDGMAEIRIVDEGPGLDPAKLEEIFDLPAASRPAEGLGISLLLARACAQAHGGRLSARAGAGAEFTVTLPLAAA